MRFMEFLGLKAEKAGAVPNLYPPKGSHAEKPAASRPRAVHAKRLHQAPRPCRLHCVILGTMDDLWYMPN